MWQSGVVGINSLRHSGAIERTGLEETTTPMMIKATPTQEGLLQLRWLLGTMLTLISLPSLMILGVAGGGWMLIAAVMLIPGLLQPKWIAGIPQGIFRWGTPLLLLVLGTDFIYHGKQIVDPLVRALAILLLWRSFQQRTAREEMQHVLLSLVLILVTGVLTQEPAFALQLLLFTPCALVHLLVITLSTADGGPSRALRPNWNEFSWKILFREQIRHFNYRFLAFSGVLYLGLIGFSGLIFLLLPRFDIGLSMGGVQAQGRTTLSGFGEELRFGDITSILQDRRVAFRVDVPTGPVQQPPYWRMLVLDQYDGNGFIRSGRPGGEPEVYHDHSFTFAGLSVPSKTPVGQEVWGPTGENTWTFYVEPNVSRFLPIPGSLSQLRFQNRQRLLYYREDIVLALPEVQGAVLFFQVAGVESTDRLPASPAITGPLEEGHPLLSLPTDPAQVQYLQSFLSERLLPSFQNTSETINVERFGQSLKAILAERGYSLETRLPPGPGDPLVRWLRSDLPGHCEFFAGAMVLLARAAGIPARVVVGFHGGDWNIHEQYYVVRNLHAHAWVELLDRTSATWVRMDPTPAGTPGAQGLSARSGIHSDHSGWRARMDSIKILWYRRVVNFDAAQQQELVQTVRRETGTKLQALWVKVQAQAQRAWQSLADWLGQTSWLAVIAIATGTGLSVLVLAALLRLLGRTGGAWHLKFWGARHLRSWNRDRRRAGILLVKLRQECEYTSTCPASLEAARTALNTIRYGPREQWPEWAEVLQLIKFCRKDHRAYRDRKGPDKHANRIHR